MRLKIIDLEHGDQPMVSDDGDTVLVFNGEIYNHAELRRELEQLGHRFHSHCDTETVLHAFLEWDIDAFARLRGMFAAAFWNESRTAAGAGARPHGDQAAVLRPPHGEDLYFGSELKAILLHPEIDRRIDLAGLDRLSLAQLRSRAATRWWKASRSSRRAHWLEWRAGAVDQRSVLAAGVQARSQAEILASAKEELDGLLRSAVREHWFPTFPWACGRAAAWIRPRSCITPARQRRRG